MTRSAALSRWLSWLDGPRDLAARGFPLIPSPHVMYGAPGRAAFESVQPAMQTADIPVVYVTDRAAETKRDGGVTYGFGRSPGISFGTATVAISPRVEWNGLVDLSTSETREHRYLSKVSGVEPIGEIPSTARLLEPREGRLRMKPDAMATVRDGQQKLFKLLSRWLDHTDRKETFVFVHGFNNTFDHSVIRLSHAWHFGGRQGVPIVFSWPAGSGGLKSYTYDRESGEFAIVHLKMLLITLARCPQIERIHLVSHSRGTDVAVTAMREMNAEARGYLRSGGLAALLHDDLEAMNRADAPEVHEMLKIETLVLAAPDLDFDVFAQRFFGENVIRAANRTVIYFSRADFALSVARWAFRSRRRIGALRLEDLAPEVQRWCAAIDALELIHCDVRGHSSHSYILQHPAAFSDLIQVITRGLKPGAEHGRPLKRIGDTIWELSNDYLRSMP